MHTPNIRAIFFSGLVTIGLLGCAEQADEALSQHAGYEVYTKYCASCHNAGVADAPKLGVKKEWQWRVRKGPAVLLQSTINGIPPGMPEKGLCLSCTEGQLADAIDYMLDAL